MVLFPTTELFLGVVGVIIICYLLKGDSTQKEEPPEAPNPSKTINIIDSVVQRSTFNMKETDDIDVDAVDALRALGYNKNQATKAVRTVQETNPKAKTTSDIVKLALRKV